MQRRARLSEKKEPLVFVNGSYVAKNQAMISVFDHGLLYGDGVYETIRTYQGIIFKLREHVDRLYESAKSIKIQLPMSRDEMIEAVVETVRKNGFKDAYIRIVVTRGLGPMGVDPRNCPSPTILIIAEPRDPIWGKDIKGISAIISSVRRNPQWALDPRIKTLNYLNNILAKIEAIEGGVEEAIMLNAEGYLAEGSTENLFIIKENKLITPPVNAGILKGITRDVAIRIAGEIGLTVEERNITIHEIYNADEVFVTGTAAEIVPVLKVSGRIIGNGKIGPKATTIIGRFRELTKDPSEGIIVKY